MNAVLPGSIGLALQAREYIDAGNPVIANSGVWRSGTERWNGNGAGNGQLCSSMARHLFSDEPHRQAICFPSGKMAVVEKRACPCPGEEAYVCAMGITQPGYLADSTQVYAPENIHDAIIGTLEVIVEAGILDS